MYKRVIIRDYYTFLLWYLQTIGFNTSGKVTRLDGYWMIKLGLLILHKQV